MKIGVVVHGPGIIDSGHAVSILNFLSNFGEVYCRLGGTMGRTAVLDASLEDIIDISEKLLPSQSLKKFKEEDMDCIFLLNYGKSQTTGCVFGYKVFNNYSNNLPDNNTPVIQIERPGEKDGNIILWGGFKKKLNINKSNNFNVEFVDIEDFIKYIGEELDLNFITPEEIRLKYFNEEDNDIFDVRWIHGVSEGENILVNGHVIGKATSNNVKLIVKDGVIVDIEGGIIKQHGVEKLGKINLEECIIKTGLLRKSTNINPRIIENTNNDNHFKIGYLNHIAEDVYKYKDCDLVVTIGDDTTEISSDILYRFNIPIIGITDGDLDKIIEKGFINENSKIVELESGYDDIIGNKIYTEIFHRNKFIIKEYPKNIDKKIFKKSEFTNLFNNIIRIVNNINCNFNIINKV